MYQIYYNWGFVWVSSGECHFNTYLDNNQFHFVAYGFTYKKYDWLYKVRDTYESWTNMTSLAPYRFNREVSEGGTMYSNHYEFDYVNSKIYSTSSKEGVQNPIDTLNLSECIFDAVSLIYYTRTINFDNYKEGDLVPLKVILDGEVFETHIKYLGKEKIKLKGDRVFNTIKFSTLLIEGSIFKGEEDMNVWVTDDKNRLPVRIEAEILVGSINGVLLKESGLTYPLISEIIE